MLDKSVPYIGVIMVKTKKGYPDFQLPQEYRFHMYEPGDELKWAELEASVDEFADEKEASTLFEKVYMPRQKELPERLVFITGKDGFAATGTMLDGTHFGSVLPRVHWVSVHPDHQGRGLAKSLMTRLLDIHAGLDKRYPVYPVYLTTQTWSYKAVNIYKKFGFEPYTGKMPEGWETQGKSFQEDNKKAWDLIERKLREYTVEKESRKY
ncbi:MAG: GNAT family N-acetyltransferase [Spirochaetia bacterium]